MFDEFEKIYDKEEQEELLTLLDGIYSSKKLFLITSNDKWRVDQHMRNRPGRIFYMVEFKGLDGDFIREYCNDNLNNKAHIETIVSIASVFSAFNFDMLKAMVEEMNRYNETPQDAMRILNVKVEFDSGAQYTVEIYKGDKKATRTSPSVWNGSPLGGKEIGINYYFETKREKPVGTIEEQAEETATCEEDNGWHDTDFSADNLVKLDSKAGHFIFEKDGATLILSKQQSRYFNFDAF